MQFNPKDFEFELSLENEEGITYDRDDDVKLFYHKYSRLYFIDTKEHDLYLGEIRSKEYASQLFENLGIDRRHTFDNQPFSLN